MALPAEEDPALWAAPMALHGFERASATSGPRARLIEGEGEWTLVVVDSSGASHRVTLPAPLTPEEREDTLALAARLLSPTPALQLPDLPPQAEPEPEPEVSPRPSAPPPANAPSVEEQVLPGLNRAPLVFWQPASQAPLLDPPGQPPRPIPPSRVASLRVGSSFGQRPDLALSAGMSADASWGSPRLQVGLAGLWASPASVPLVPGGSAGEIALMGGIWWLPKMGASLGLHSGITRRSWSLDEVIVVNQALPTARVMAGWRLPLGRIELEPCAELRVDLGRTDLVLGERSLGTLAPWQAGVSVAFRAQTDPFDRPEALPP